MQPVLKNHLLRTINYRNIDTECFISLSDIAGFMKNNFVGAMIFRNRIQTQTKKFFWPICSVAGQRYYDCLCIALG